VVQQVVVRGKHATNKTARSVRGTAMTQMCRCTGPGNLGTAVVGMVMQQRLQSCSAITQHVSVVHVEPATVMPCW